MRWFCTEWWKYLLAPKSEDVSWIATFWCRARGHPCGCVWFNSSGDEPDYHCKNCGDYIG